MALMPPFTKTEHKWVFDSILLLNFVCRSPPFSFLNIYLISDSLEDKQLLEFSEKITNKNDLRKLGVKVLQISNRCVETACENNPRDIQSAVQDVLKQWLLTQDNREIAYSNLVKNLHKSDFKILAKELKDIVEGKEETNGENDTECQDAVERKEGKNYENGTCYVIQYLTCLKLGFALQILLIIFSSHVWKSGRNRKTQVG